MRILALVPSGLHIGYLGCYGNEWIATPALDRLAAEGIVFDRHYADSLDPSAALAAWQTGRYCFPLPNKTAALPSLKGRNLLFGLADHGIETVLISDLPPSLRLGYYPGWNQTLLLQPEKRDSWSQEQTIRVVVKTLKQLAAKENWLVKVQLSSLLTPPMSEELIDASDESEQEDASCQAALEGEAYWGPVSAEDATFLELQARYAATVEHLDTGVGQLLDELDRLALIDEILILFTADRSQLLVHQSQAASPHPLLTEELIHLPLILRLPRKVAAGRRSPAFTQPVDLLPTFFDAFGLPALPTQGHNLMPLIEGREAHLRAYACSGASNAHGVEWSLHTPAWSFYLPVRSADVGPTAKPRLYVKPDDCWEVNDVCAHHPELAQYYEKTLRGFVEATLKEGPFRAPELENFVEQPFTAAQPYDNGPENTRGIDT